MLETPKHRSDPDTPRPSPAAALHEALTPPSKHTGEDLLAYARFAAEQADADTPKEAITIGQAGNKRKWANIGNFLSRFLADYPGFNTTTINTLIKEMREYTYEAKAKYQQALNEIETLQAQGQDITQKEAEAQQYYDTFVSGGIDALNYVQATQNYSGLGDENFQNWKRTNSPSS